METIGKVIKGDSFRIAPLSSQIEAAGGVLNNSTTAERIDGTFSYIYEFNTGSGRKQLITKNEYLVGVISEDVTHRAYYNGDTKTYLLYSFEKFDENDKPVYGTLVLGKSFKEMQQTLKARFPNRVVWNLCDPMLALVKS
ncbi:MULTISPECIES: hypothetical protein [Pseudoalteromonas]|uniref:hypothetical protein n=1 Tax=Pseudoalteromonas TaxID=53246 RepID=UPI001581FF74|nr:MULTISPECIES: hypothetical protein [Pseudoalteromonas]MDI4654240.1 hypothetical protein [Pseudoalteromonas shioyasakiensis]NUJ40194.1 hypothetical protein [Pseudoalteromonas sp. 0303]